MRIALQAEIDRDASVRVFGEGNAFGGEHRLYESGALWPDSGFVVGGFSGYNSFANVAPANVVFKHRKHL
jgi:hypothetical protein